VGFPGDWITLVGIRLVQAHNSGSDAYGISAGIVQHAEKRRYSIFWIFVSSYCLPDCGAVEGEVIGALVLIGNEV